MCIGKVRHLIFPHKNFKFWLLRIWLSFLCNHALQFSKETQILPT
jgi:hypothetical protein